MIHLKNVNANKKKKKQQFLLLMFIAYLSPFLNHTIVDVKFCHCSYHNKLHIRVSYILLLLFIYYAVYYYNILILVIMICVLGNHV